MPPTAELPQHSDCRDPAVACQVATGLKKVGNAVTGDTARSSSKKEGV